MGGDISGCSDSRFDAVQLKLRSVKLIKILCVEIFQFIFIRIKDIAKELLENKS